MKKFFMLSVLSLSLAALSNQTASAWSSCKLGVGLNFEMCGGGNSFLWGAYKSAPGPMDGGMPGYGGYPGHADGSMDGFAMAGDQGQPFAFNMSTPASAPQQAVQFGGQWGGNMGSQPVMYYPSTGYNYYPSSGYNYYPTASYGYGR